MSEAVEIIKAMVNDLGFPIAMVVYFIIDKYKTTSQLVTAINNNNMILEKILTKFDIEDFRNE